MVILKSSRVKGRNRDNTAVHKDMRFDDYRDNDIGFRKLYTELLNEVDEPFLFGSKKEEAIEIVDKIEKFSAYSDSKLFDIWNDKIELYSSGALERVAKAMIYKVRTKKGGVYENSVLTKNVTEHKNTKTFVQQVSDGIATTYKKVNGEVSRLKDTSRENSVLKESLVYNEIKEKVNILRMSDKFSGLGILINEVWAYEVVLTKINVPLSKKPRHGQNIVIDLRFELHDHFGLDFPDLVKYDDHDIFFAWFVLQHFKGFPPLLTTIKFNKQLKFKM